MACHARQRRAPAPIHQRVKSPEPSTAPARRLPADKSRGLESARLATQGAKRSPYGAKRSPYGAKRSPYKGVEELELVVLVHDTSFAKAIPLAANGAAASNQFRSPWIRRRAESTYLRWELNRHTTRSIGAVRDASIAAISSDRRTSGRPSLSLNGKEAFSGCSSYFMVRKI
jgi:hypothetical protein